MTLSAATTTQQPDFAFPTKVISKSLADLDKAIDTGDGKLIVRSLIDYDLAQCSIDPDSMKVVLDKIKAVTEQQSDPRTKALLNTLLAGTYSAIYTSQRWIYDNRDIPAAPGNDYKLWSGKQFRDTIISLTESSLADADALKSAPLKDYASIILTGDHTCEFYPTLYDFVTLRAITTLKGLSYQNYMFSINLLCRYDVYESMRFNYTSPVAAHILSLYRDALEFHKHDAAPFIMYDIDRIDFINDNLYTPGDSEDALKKKDELLLDLYNRFSASPYSAEALIAMGSGMSDSKMYDLITKRLAANPRYFNNGCLKNRLLSLTEKSLDAEYNNTVVPGDSLRIKVTNFNTRDYELRLYRIPYVWKYGSSGYQITKSTKLSAPVKTVRVTETDSIPFKKSDYAAAIQITQPGCYIIVPVISGQQVETGRYYPAVHCTDLSIQTAAFNDNRWAYITNPATGRPATGQVKISVMNGNGNIANVLYTGNDATTSLASIGGNNIRLFASKGSDRFASPAYLPYSRPADTATRYIVHAYTDLAVYHPGDSMQWSGVVQSYVSDKAATVGRGYKMKVTLHDPNYQIRDTAIVTTDDFGRITGAFKLPEDGFTGRYVLEFMHPKQTDRWRSLGSRAFIVSDYKLPTYKVEVTDIISDTPEKGGITVKGNAMTYSGFPVAGCNVAINLSASPRLMWWRSPSPASFYSTTVETDDEGNFTVQFPAGLLATSPVPEGIFTVKLTATSPTGESQETSCNFTTGRPYILSATLATDIDASLPLRPAISLENLTGGSIDAVINYTFTVPGDKKPVATGSFKSASPVIDLSNVPSGVYSVTFATADSSLADPVTIEGTAIYRPGDAVPPVTDTPLWVPVKSYTIKDGRELSVLYGIPAEEGWVHYAVYSVDRLLAQGWLHEHRGIHRFKWTLPENIDQVTVTLSSVNGYRFKSADVSARTARSIKSLSIGIESFRDRITPGQNETWKIKVRQNGKDAVKAAVMLDMYSKALDAIQPFSFKMSPTFGYTGQYRINQSDAFGISSSYASVSFRGERCDNIMQPQFNTWGMPLYDVNRIHDLRLSSVRVRGGRAMMVNKSMSDEVVMEEKMMYAAAATESTEEEAAVSADDADTGATDANGNNGSNDNFNYRAALQPLAFFHPELTTDADGNMEFSFTAPDANTTWRLCALAFTTDMLTTSLDKDIIASKPVMVQPNLPRFLRNGDSAVVSASVMNNSEDEAVINTSIELFDPITGQVTGSFTHVDTVAPSQAVAIDTPVKVSAEAGMIGYRIKASTETFADGEQAVIPVLPASQPVIETLPFYIAPDDRHFEMKLPEMPADARVTLQYCDNPTWYVVTALPGLRKDDAKDALSASAALFSAAIAEGILKTDPAIAEALKEWNSSDRTDSTLVSMLERNSDLKTMLLSSTPWLADARSDTERMSRLALLFDKEVIASTYNKAIHTLSLLECGNGGWAWVSQYKQPSVWITENILFLAGQLKKLGYLPADKKLNDMLLRAVGYLDRKVPEGLKSNPSMTDINYVWVRDYYPEIARPQQAKVVTDNTLRHLRSVWKEFEAPIKGIAAIVLYNHNYKTLAKTILASLREFAVHKPAYGMWWPSLDKLSAWPQGKIGATSIILDAFNTVEPDCADIDLIRQWLILQKESKDWGTSVTTSQAIASILLSGDKWTVPASPAIIKLSGSEIKATDTDRLLGYFRTGISTLRPSNAMLTIDRAGDTPAWGAVYAQFTDVMSSIKASSCEEVSIEKQLYKRINTKDGVQWVDADSLKTGDIVQVNLIVTTSRDMDYVAIDDNRGACFEPVEQLPKPIVAEGLYFYRENLDASTNIFITHLPKGVYRLSYELYVNNAGTYSAGIATIQSQYAPALTAHSSGSIITIAP